jgi:hypothetical protein
LFTPATARKVFGDPRYNPDHPPLGRLWIGVTHDLVLAIAPPAERAGPYSVVCARVAPATAFALTVFLVGFVAARWYGRTAGWVAAAALVLMPRAFGHAHLAALETFVGLTFAATVLYVGSRWAGSRESRVQSPEPMARRLWTLDSWLWTSLIAGVLFGLTLLTKIQAVLLPVPIGLWCLWRWGWRGAAMMLVFGLTGLAVFFAAWPWLWLDPVGHFQQYLGRTVERPTLYCYYLGERYADRDVPWHYVFVMFAVTAPIGLQCLGAWSAVRLAAAGGNIRGLTSPARLLPSPVGRVDERAALLLVCIGFVLTFFAMPGITVYDGERLFLVVLPLWAVLIGCGGQMIVDRVCRETMAEPNSPGGSAGASPSLGGSPSLAGAKSRPESERLVSRSVTATLGLLIGTQVVGNVVLHPCQLSYYNLFVGGLAGANRLGFEATYWRDSFTRDLLREAAAAVPEGATLYVAPVLHPANLGDLEQLSPILARRGLVLDSYDDQDPAKRSMRYVLVFRRQADPWGSLEPAPAGAKLLAEVRRQGVQLAAAYDLRPGELP